MYYLQSRYYDPVVKRMLCADDESLTAGAALNNNNLFSYCDNNPVNRADCNGDIWNVVAGAVIGATLNIGATYLVNYLSGTETTAKDVIAAGIAGAATGAIGGFTSVVCSTSQEAIINAVANGVVETAANVYTTVSKGMSLKDEAPSIIVNSVGAAITGAGSALAGPYKATAPGMKALKNIKIKGTKIHTNISKGTGKAANLASSGTKNTKRVSRISTGKIVKNAFQSIKNSRRVRKFVSFIKPHVKSALFSGWRNMKRRIFTIFYNRRK